MGKLDDEWRSYLEKAQNLADFLNGTLYGGKQVITVEQLAEIQRIYRVVLQGRNGKRRKRRKERDVVRALCRYGHIMIVAVEVQGLRHFFMPGRCAEYDLYDLLRQHEEKKKCYQKNKGLSSPEEYLSKSKREDKYRPVLTIVLYLGNDWDAATSLQELYDMGAVDEAMRPWILNHEIKVITLADMDENCFHTGLREIVGMMKRREDKSAMLKFYEENRCRFEKMDEEAFKLLCTTLNMKSLLKTKEKLERNETMTATETGGKTNMCKAFDEILQDQKKLGEKRGEARMSKLVELLMKDGRTNEILNVTQNLAARRRLYKEYGM